MQTKYFAAIGALALTTAASAGSYVFSGSTNQLGTAGFGKNSATLSLTAPRGGVKTERMSGSWTLVDVHTGRPVASGKLQPAMVSMQGTNVFANDNSAEYRVSCVLADDNMKAVDISSSVPQGCVLQYNFAIAPKVDETGYSAGAGSYGVMAYKPGGMRMTAPPIDEPPPVYPAPSSVALLAMAGIAANRRRR